MNLRHSGTFSRVAFQQFTVRIFPWGGPKYRFQNFGQCNLGEHPLPPSGVIHPRGSGYFPKLPKRVCAAQQGRDFGTLLFTAKLVCRVASWDVWVKS